MRFSLTNESVGIIESSSLSKIFANKMHMSFKYKLMNIDH
jgi:hypothetical protein